MMEINRYISDLMDSNMYIIAENNHAIVIDPFRNTSLGEGFIIDMIILTHEHYDHISGVNEWVKFSQAPVLCSKNCALNIQNTRMNLAKHFKEFCELQNWIKADRLSQIDRDYTCNADIVFEDELSFDWMNHLFFLFEMPGHSQGSIGILVDDQHFFSGDSLLNGIDMEFRMPGGSKKDWERIGRKRLSAVPDNVTVFPGHMNAFVFDRNHLVI